MWMKDNEVDFSCQRQKNNECEIDQDQTWNFEDGFGTQVEWEV